MTERRFPELTPETMGWLAAVNTPVHLQVFSTPT